MAQLDGTMLVVAPAVVLVLAVPVVWLALRGRRVDDHPLCRTCGFDLFGTPAASTRCNECGADLTRRRAVRVGNRQTRRRLLAAALPLPLLSAGWLGVLGYGSARGTDWNQKKPLWWLARDLEGRDASARAAAAAELDARAADGRLPAAEVRALVDRALAHQADHAQPWLPGHGLLLERLRAGGRLGRDDWQRYLAQAVRLRAEVLAAPGGTSPVSVRLTGAVRIGTDSRFQFHQLIYGVAEVGGQPYLAGNGSWTLTILYSGSAGMSADVELGPASRAALPPGTHSVELPVRIMLGDPLGPLVRAEPEYRSVQSLRATAVVPPAAEAGPGPKAAGPLGPAAYREGRP